MEEGLIQARMIFETRSCTHLLRLLLLHVCSPSFPHDLITFIYRVVFNPNFCSWHIFFILSFFSFYYPLTFLIYPAGPSTASEAFRSDSLHVSGGRFMSVSCVHFCACMCVCACVCVRVCVCYVLSHFLYYV